LGAEEIPMIWRELSATLADLIAAVIPSAESGLIVTAAELDVPLEVVGGLEQGQLVIYGTVPHSRWKAGFLPPVHVSRLVVTLVEEERTAADHA
jgi:hypothetical protein